MTSDVCEELPTRCVLRVVQGWCMRGWRWGGGVRLSEGGVFKSKSAKKETAKGQKKSHSSTLIFQASRSVCLVTSV